jgi:glycosyltransferase involved in cell wall biosynthesis
MHDEETNVAALFERLGGALSGITADYEIVCVNDGSSDGTLAALLAARAADPRVVVVDLARNFGKELALTAGLDHARGRAVIPIDADLQDPPELIARMVARWREGYEVVYAHRRSRDGEDWLKLTTARLFYRVINRCSEVPIPDDCGDYRLLDRRVVDVVRSMPERVRFNKGLFAWAGFRQTSVDFDRDPRAAGRSNWSYLKLWRLAIDGITSFSAVPLKVWTYVGIVVALLAFVYGTVLIARTIVLGVDVPGYASLIVIVLFLGGANLIGIGILGEYIGRIFDEVKQRPLYVLREVHGPDRDDA